MTTSTAAASLDAFGLRIRERLTWDTARHVAIRSAVWGGTYLAALLIFGAFVASRHANPWSMYHAMWDTVTSGYGRGQVFDKAAPFILGALAVAVPARAGIVNIGGEGQIVVGATAAGGMSLLLGTSVTGVPALALMALTGAGAGAAWAGIAAVLRLRARVNEAISTLLLNYVAADVLSYVVYGPWKDAGGNGQPASKLLPADDFLPGWGFIDAHVGILIALAAAAVVAFAMRRTRWGFALRAIGGNPEASRRAGLGVAGLVLSALLVGGALAGLGGMIQYTTLEGQLRPGVAATFGYTGFLASWLGRHQPFKVVLAAGLLAAIAVAGNSLQIASNLPGSAVNILMAVVLLAVLSQRPLRKGA